MSFEWIARLMDMYSGLRLSCIAWLLLYITMIRHSFMYKSRPTSLKYFLKEISYHE